MSTASLIPHRLRRLFSSRCPPTCTIEQLFLLHRPTRTLVQHAIRSHKNRNDPISPIDLRSIASMVTYLLSFLREPTHLDHYLELGHLHIEQFTYGFHSGNTCILLSVLHAPPDAAVAPALAECQQILELLHRHHLDAILAWADNPHLPLPNLLPNLDR